MSEIFNALEHVQQEQKGLKEGLKEGLNSNNELRAKVDEYQKRLSEKEEVISEKDEAIQQLTEKADRKKETAEEYQRNLSEKEGMNIYQRIILVIGGIALALVVLATLDVTTKINRVLSKVADVTINDLEATHILLKNECIFAIAYSVIVAALTFSAYIGFKSRY